MICIKKWQKVTISFLILILLNLWILTPLHQSAKEVFQEEQRISLPILMYHNLSKKAGLLGRYVVSVEQFEKDLKYIQENKFTPITMTELIEYVYEGEPLPEKPIMITFDDGYESFYAYAYPLLQKYNMKAVMSIVGAYTDLFTKTPDHNLDYSHLTWDEVNEMSKSGLVEIQNHSFDMHKNGGDRKGCAKKNRENVKAYEIELKQDLLKMQEETLQFTGIKPNTFTYPYGALCPEALPILKEMGFRAALTCYEVKNEITASDSEALYSLGRFNRESGVSTEQFFAKLAK